MSALRILSQSFKPRQKTPVDNCTGERFVNFSNLFEPFKLLKMYRKPLNFESYILELNSQIFIWIMN